MDGVERILEQWKAVRSDLKVEPMGLIGRIKRLNLLLGREMDRTFAAHGLNLASFDVLATLVSTTNFPFPSSRSDSYLTSSVEYFSNADM